MRYAPEHKQRTRERIVEAAGRVFRRQGFTGASVERVMGRAGLTVGGFYAHFSSKRALLVAALRGLMAERARRAAAVVEGLRGPAALRAFAKAYVDANTDAAKPGEGCPVVPVLSELARADPRMRAAFAEELEGLVGTLAGAAGGRDARAQALRTIATCFGGIAIARATRATALSEEVIAACRRARGA